MSDILEKIRKLMALATSSNPHEAAAAAAKAQALAGRYKIDMAALALEAGEKPRGFDVRNNVIWREEGTYCTGWVKSLACGVARANKLRPYFQGNTYYGVGDSGDAEVTTFLVGWLVGEVERLYKEAKPKQGKGMGKSWGASFRAGCVMTILSRLTQEAEEETKKLRVSEDKKDRYAMQLIDEHKMAVDKYVEEKLKLRNVPNGRLTSAAGFSAGREAGARAHLRGNGLPG